MRYAFALPTLLVLLFITAPALAQPNNAFIPGGQNQGLGNNQENNQAQPNQGGGQNADFESLIELIIATVDPDSWAENGGGEAEIRPYVSGVYADANGLLRRALNQPKGTLSDDLDRARAKLATVREKLLAETNREATDPRSRSALRFVSLGRLERELDRRLAAGEPLEQAMLTLAGLERVRYIILLPASEAFPRQDVVLAGPAGDWRMVGDGRIVSKRTGEAIVRLDDLITLMRRVWQDNAGDRVAAFGCSINPREESLAAAQAFLNKSQAKPVPSRKRAKWLSELRGHVGEQDIEVFGVDPTSRVAGVLVEADHHMKLVGMGLAEGVPGVEDYLTGLAQEGDTAASTGVLRWWFAMNYGAIHSTREADAFELVGPGAMVLSEKELLNSRGQRTPVGAGDELAAEFAASFTRHFAALSRKFPVYSELRNVFDLSLVAQLVKQSHERNPAGWEPGLFNDAKRLPLPTYKRALTVETVVNHQVVNRKRFVAGVSGGVMVNPAKLLKNRKQQVEREGYGPLGEEPITLPANLPNHGWWWDA